MQGIKTVDELRAALALMHATALTKALTEAANKKQTKVLTLF